MTVRRPRPRLFRRAAVTTAVAAAAVVGVATPALAWDVDALYGQRRSCAEGYLDVGVASQLDAAQFSNGSLHFGGRVKDGCTDGQLMQLWYRQVNVFGTKSGWSVIQTGNNFHSAVGWRPSGSSPTSRWSSAAQVPRPPAVSDRAAPSVGRGAAPGRGPASRGPARP